MLTVTLGSGNYYSYYCYYYYSYDRGGNQSLDKLFIKGHKTIKRLA